MPNGSSPAVAVPPNDTEQYSALEDGEQLELALEGNAEAFRAFMQRYGGVVSGYFFGRSRNSAEAAEMVAQTFLSLHRDAARVKALSPVGPYLLAYARDVWRRAAREREEEPRYRRPVPQAPADFVAMLERTPNVKEISPEPEGLQAYGTVVSTAIGRLPDGLRIMVYLRVLEARTPRDIAQLLGLTERAVRKGLARGLRRVRRMSKVEEMPAEEENSRESR